MKRRPEVIALTGGIGSGKSTVARVLRTMGYRVYDCDHEAKQLMDSSDDVRSWLCENISPSAVDGVGRIDRSVVSAAVFADSQLLEGLNSVVHSLVRDHLQRWIDANTQAICFVETAILYQSGLDRMVDAVWEVIAPEPLRIERVKARSGLTDAQVKARIDSQDAYEVVTPHAVVRTIVNDGVTPLLPRINSLLLYR